MISVSVLKEVSSVKHHFINGVQWTVYDFDKLYEYKTWCKEFVGADKWNYYGPDKKVPCEFRFKNPEDALAFKIRFNLIYD